MFPDERRRARRFPLWLTMMVVRVGSEPVEFHGETTNVSSRGIQFVIGETIPEGESIQYLFALGRPGPSTRCYGRVVRSRRLLAGAGNEIRFQISATIDRYEFRAKEEAAASCAERPDRSSAKGAS